MTWHENGQQATESTYNNGKQDGKEISYRRNGQKQTERTYQDGLLFTENRWDQNGNPL